jgi:DNA-binding MarR family transcriptional regulator
VHEKITLLIICGVTDTQDLLFLLHDVARLLRHEADRRARSRDMTRAQWVILFWLDRQPGLSQKELSELLEVEPISVARLIDRLEARGMVERRPDPKDRRIWRLHLLPPASPVLTGMQTERADIHRMATAHIDGKTETIMIEGLKQMKATLVGECRGRTGEREPALKLPAMKAIA